MPNRSFGRPIEILLVEDNPADVRLTQEGLKEAKVSNVMHAVGNGKDALDYLFQRGTYADASRPDLVLLDLNLPGVSGYDVLSAVKADPDLRTIPVVVLTSSESETDRTRAYEQHANCFISKPVDFDGFLEIVKSIEDFWFSVVSLPPTK